MPRQNRQSWFVFYLVSAAMDTPPRSIATVVFELACSNITRAAKHPQPARPRRSGTEQHWSWRGAVASGTYQRGQEARSLVDDRRRREDVEVHVHAVQQLQRPPATTCGCAQSFQRRWADRNGCAAAAPPTPAAAEVMLSTMTLSCETAAPPPSELAIDTWKPTARQTSI